MRAIDLLGGSFGRLEVVARAKNDKQGKARWLCQCECGNKKIIRSEHLRSGVTKSCGCYNRESTTKRNTTHGESQTRLYSIWSDMRARCNTENDNGYYKYGARGIKVCNEWNDSYTSFRDWAVENGYKDNLTIDRMNNDGNYEPGNCRWVGLRVQANNKRNNTVVKYKGVTYTVAELSRATGMNYNTLLARIRKYEDVDLAVEKPVMTHGELMAKDNEYRKAMIVKYSANKPNAIAVEMLDKETDRVLRNFDKLMDGAKWIRENTDYSKADYSTINKVCKGRGKTAYGYKWRYKQP